MKFRPKDQNTKMEGEKDYVWIWDFDSHEHARLPKYPNSLTRYHPQPESPLCDHAGCPGDCLRRAHLCRHRNCNRNCLLTPSMRAWRYKVSRERIRAFNDFDVTYPDLYARIQETISSEHTTIPYGEYLAIMEKGENCVALLYVDSKRGGDASHYRELTLKHMKVLVAIYTWNWEMRRFMVVANKLMRYSAYLKKRQKFPNWKGVVLEVTDEFGRDGCDQFWRDRFKEIRMDCLYEMEEWRYLQGWPALIH